MKRFTDTDKWFDEWFRKLPTDYKLFWNYLCDRCNNAGVWKVDIDLACYVMGAQVTLDQAMTLYGDRVTVLRSGYWFIRGFVPFQYGELSTTNRMHLSVLSLLEKEGASKALKRPINRGQGKDKDKDKVKDKEGVLGGFDFEAVWSRYPRREGRKEAERHFAASVKTDQDFADIQKALDNYIAQLRKEATEPRFIKMGSTWFNNWRDYVTYNGPAAPRPAPVILPPRPKEKELSDEDSQAAAKFFSEAKKNLPRAIA